MTARTIVILEGDQTGQELLEEALRVIDPDFTGLNLEFERFDLSLENRRSTQNQCVYEAAEAWKVLVAESVPNAYILEGGINNWIATFGEDDLTKSVNAGAGDDQLCYIFDTAIGDRYSAAGPNPESHELEYTPKVKLELKRAPTSGGCG